MAVRVIAITSAGAGAGKTHFAAGVARWLKTRGYQVAPLHLSTRRGDPVVCPGGGQVTRAAALLAEACGLAPAPEFDSAWTAVEPLLEQHDLVIAELAAGVPVPDHAVEVRVRARDRRLEIECGDSLPFFEPDLMPAPDEELAHLPAWRFGAGPRAGVVSLPHITNFTEYGAFRGAEWLASPPAGRFGVLFVPGSSNEASDLEWLRGTGLLGWLEAQREAGARIVVSGWGEPAPAGGGTVRLAVGELLDHREASRQLGLRMPAPLPGEEVLEQLGEWAGRWLGVEALAASLR